MVSLSAQEWTGLRDNPLFAGKTWRWSPEAWSLLSENRQLIESLGTAAVSFYRTIERLYLKSKANQRILRNEELLVPWVCHYYDAGKPDWLVEVAPHYYSQSEISTLAADPRKMPKGQGRAAGQHVGK